MTPHERQCKVCKYGPENIDWSLSNTAIGNVVDCGKDSVRRHRDWAEVNGFDLGRGSTTLGFGHDFPDTGVPGVWRPRRHWQTAAGEPLSSFEFIPAGDADIEDLIDNERIDRVLASFPDPRPSSIFAPDGLTELLVIADPQLGKAGERGGGTDDTIFRIYRGVAEAIEKRYADNNPAELYLIDAGDIIENIFSTKQQIVTNDRELPQQIEDAILVYLKVIGMLLPHVGKLYHVTVTSNHGEARNEQKVNPSTSENDWGLAIQRMVKARCGDRGWDVEFLRPGVGEDTAAFETVDGTKVAVNHGHHSGSPAGVKKWITGQIVGRQPGWDSNLWILGHYHHPYFFPVGDGRTVFGTPSIDPGSSWFTRKTGEESPPGLTAITVNRGRWYNYTVYVTM